ncbi:MAG: polysaccharide biosynthesis tyrosine autokinase [Anaerolineales bacterium]|nr:polysaccharide biosynthesis tyrosine autokinase [Anaerolineales bacterium]MCB8961247.1 polysaccharide biosynthesis tyrosine autokinase [Ardenticatenales bacterium]MCB0005071.1 polysaccharide biosynthesis tyrosine autokinase [Anaerolineales bacterium]MCB0010785.1 polysaccharide biosynthesis tyrosine autokinase [Anaerolineales bacterium]MCB0018722.1 polysaccharide biosynthesis tyrosine autokinase [Anaerolineales bacterium]
MEVRRYLALFWQWAWLIVLVTLITGSVAYIVNKQTEPVYQAQAKLMVDLAPGEDYRDIIVEELLSQTYVELIRTRPVREETAARLGLTSVGGIDVTNQSGTQFILLTVENTDPELAAAIANTVGEVFIDLNAERNAARYSTSIANWDSRLVELDLDIAEIETKINELNTSEDPDLVQLSRLERQLNEARYSYEEAFGEREGLNLQFAQEVDKINIVEAAIPNFNPIRPKVLTNTLLATFIGAITAIGIVFLIEYLDDTIRTPDELAADKNLAPLGAIAFIKGETQSDRLVTYHTPRSPISEAYRVLRTNLSFSAIDDGFHSFLVTSSSPSEGKSTTVANLAVAIGQTGQRVIVVDADLRRPTQHKIFEVSNNQGLTTALLDADTPVSYHVQNTKVPGVRVLTSGPLPPNPAELLNSQRMVHIINDLKEECDVFICDTPPTLTVADASILARHVDGVTLVVQLGKTRRESLGEAAERLNKADAKLYGTILNQQRQGRGGYYDYYYYYRYYSYEYGDNRPGRPRRRLLGWLSGSSR